MSQQPSRSVEIHRLLFRPSRAETDFDSDLPGVLAKARRLLVERGIFHLKVHFSSAQVTLWSMHDPYSYQVYSGEEFLRTGFAASFPSIPYPINAVVPPNRIDDILAVFRDLRVTDRAIRLRSGSLNIINGLVELNFTSEASHYLPYEDLLAGGGKSIA